MTDPNDHMNSEITPEEYPGVVAQYQQWLADRDLTLASLRIKLAKSNARLQLALEDKEKAEAEVEVIRGSRVPINAESDDSE